MLDQHKKLIIQIPCYNEEKNLAATLRDLPRQLAGIDKIEYLVVDDGSVDQTSLVAKQNGVHHIVRLFSHQGLARAFVAGIESCLKLGADIIVNTDADNQYFAGDINKLIKPILAGQADMVIGARPIDNIKHFSWQKKIFQKLGSWLVRQVSHTKVVDAPSGFRAISRQAAMKLNVFNEYTYTLETIVQAGQKGMVVVSVPISVNGPTRPSRLIKSIPAYIGQSIVTILRIFITYRPFRFFMSLGLISFVLGLIIGSRFLWFYLNGFGTGHVQSLILAALLLGSGLFLFIIGILADIISVNRKLLEKIDERLKLLDGSLNKRKDVK